MIYSYSNLKMLKTCPLQCFRTYVKKDLPFHETTESIWGNRVHDALKDRLRKVAPLPDDLQKYEGFCLSLDRFDPKTEIMLGCDRDGNACGFFGKHVWLRGKADVVVVDKTTAALFDWKTGKPFEDPFELAVQALLLKINMPILSKISGQYIWLKEMRLGRTHDLRATAVTWGDVVLLHERTERYEKAGEWPKSPNVLCGWCRVHDCEHNPEYQKNDARGEGQAGSHQVA